MAAGGGRGASSRSRKTRNERGVKVSEQLLPGLSGSRDMSTGGQVVQKDAACAYPSFSFYYKVPEALLGRLM